MTGPQTAGVILAGGLSRRMAGVDKGLIALAGVPMLARIIDRLRPQVGPLAVNANGDPARFARFGLPVLPDPVPGHPGPLAGILAALRWAKQVNAPLVVTVPADTPFVPADLVERLAAVSAGAEVAVAHSRGAEHPTVALWSTGLVDDLAAWLGRTGDRSVRAWIATRRAVSVAFDDSDGEDPFFNINTPADLASAEKRARESGSQGR